MPAMAVQSNAGLESSFAVIAVERRAEHAGLIHLQLGAHGQHDPLSKTYQCCCFFTNPFVQFSAQGEVAGDSGAQISGALHHLENVVTNGDAWTGCC